MAHFPGASQAAADFCFALINGKCFDHTLSMVPISITPDIRKMCSHPLIDFIQIRIVPQIKILRFLNMLSEAMIVIVKSLPYRRIWFYNITNANVLPALVLKYLFFRKVYVLLADYTPPSRRFSMASITGFAIRKSDGIISLSGRSTISHRRWDVLAGVIPEARVKKTVTEYPAERNFLFSGLLEKFKGVNMALEVFSRIPEAQLFISGRGHEEEICKKYAQKFPNIHYLGFLSKKEYDELFSKITFCLNFRDPSYPENLNNFPSKILEYLLYGKAVISTIRYPELGSIFYLLEEKYDPDTLIALIRYCMQMPQTDLMRYTSHSDSLKVFSEHSWQKLFAKIEGVL